jgi:hypothetical protein
MEGKIHDAGEDRDLQRYKGFQKVGLPISPDQSDTEKKYTQE